MKNLVIALLLIFITSCGKDSDSGGTSGVSSSKGFWSTWQEDSSGYVYYMSGGAFSSLVTLYFAKVVVTSSWITSLSNAGRTNLPTVGSTYTCTYGMYVIGDNVSGVFSFDTGSIADTVSNNACLMYDSDCHTDTVCAISADHSYTLSNDTLTIDWFGNTDNSLYGISTFK